MKPGERHKVRDVLIWSPGCSRREIRYADGRRRIVDLGCFTFASASALCQERGITLQIWPGRPRVSVGRV